MSKPNEQEQIRDYPKWVDGTLCKDAEAEAALVPAKPDPEPDTLETMKMKSLVTYASAHDITIPDEVHGVKETRIFLAAYRDAK